MTRSARRALDRAPEWVFWAFILCLLALLAGAAAVANAGDGTARCDGACRAAIKAAAEAWMRPAVPQTYTLSTPCECGDCAIYAVYSTAPSLPSSSSAYYECKAKAAHEREEAQAKAEQERRAQEAREDAAREAMYRVRDACGEGPERPR